MRTTILALAAALALPGLLPTTGAVNPLDNDAGTGGDAPDDFEDAVRILPGAHTGSVARPHDPWDWYAVELAADEALFLDTAWSFAVLVGPDGRGNAWGVPGPGVARIGMSARWDSGPYAFRVDVFPKPPQDDAGTGGDAPAVPGARLADGRSAGTLAPWDAEDAYLIPTPARTRLRVAVESPGNVHVTLGLSTGFGSRVVLTHLAAQDGELPLILHGETAYTIEVERTTWAPAGDFPAFELLARHPGFAGDAATAPDGAALLATSGGLLRVADGGVVTLRAVGAHGVAVDAAGEILASTSPPGGKSRIAALRADHEDPIAEGGGALALAPDGGIWRALDGKLERLDCAGDRGAVFRPGGPLRAFAFAPDGALHAIVARGLWEAELVRFDRYGTPQRVADVPLASALAFDADGVAWLAGSQDGGLYRVAEGRLDAVGVGPRGVSALAVAADGIVVGTDDGVIGRFVLPTRPSLPLGRCDAAPTADLAVVAFREERPALETPGHARRLLLTLENVGRAAAPSSLLQVTRACSPQPPSCAAEWPATPVARCALDRCVGGAGPPAWYVGRAATPPLAPGERATVVVEWDTTHALGDQVLYARADAADEVLEGDEADNLAKLATSVGAAGYRQFL